MLLLRRFQYALPLLPLILSSLPALAQSHSPSSTISVREYCIPENARAAFNQGLQHFEKYDFSGSARFFFKAIHKFPDFYEAYYQLGLAQVHLNQTDNAARSFQTAIDLSGGHYPLAAFAYALLLCNQGQLTDAERLVRHGLEQNQNAPDGYVVLGVVLAHFNRLDEAEHNAREALSRSPHAYEAYLLLAYVHDQRKDYSAEIRDFDNFLAAEHRGPRADHVQELRKIAQQHVTVNPVGK
ncbi:MAG TPA: tetratricopeptide repeat protein [Candidatus Sulfotelmatobacter sp.]|nr:tetratricopeptide repeat protein [Candidatus Sulfotelmatobacter sp.]